MGVKKTKSSEVALKVEHVSKSFRLPTEQANGIKQAFINRVRGIKGYTEQHVLKDISFTVEKGDFFGIVGRNGSGKSTLLKLISQIYEPDAGEIIVDGKLVPFIELGVGFNPELTGRENVYLNGALLGFSHEDMSAMYDDIVEFAELEEFMDQKLKNYSSGMQVRLAFSIAIKADADILVLDEVLAVGDEAFQRKCFNYFAELKKNKKTVILVTHAMESVMRFCNKAALIDKGHRLEIGKPSDIAQLYRELNFPEEVTTSDDVSKQSHDFTVFAKSAALNDTVHLRFDVVPHHTHEDSNAAVTCLIIRDNGEIVYRYASDEKSVDGVDIRKPIQLDISLQNIFPEGVYEVQLGIKRMDRGQDYGIFDKVTRFTVVNRSMYPGDNLWKPHEKSHVVIGNSDEQDRTELIVDEIKALIASKSPFVLLAGTPRHSNIGDRAIAYAEIAFIQKHFKDIAIAEVPFGFDLERLPNIPDDVPIYLHGGGNFGDIWHNEEEYRKSLVRRFKNNRMLLFPQTVFFQDMSNLKTSAEVYQQHPSLTLIAREKQSFQLMKENFSRNTVLLTPDIVMSLDVNMKDVEKNQTAVFCIRNDREKTVPDDDILKIEELVRSRHDIDEIVYSDMHTADEYTGISHEDIVRMKLRELAAARLVVTDRLHGMVLAMIAGTPCVVLGSKTYKTSGVYEWIKQDPRNAHIVFCATMKAARAAIKTIDTSESHQHQYDPRFYDAQWQNIVSAMK